MAPWRTALLGAALLTGAVPLAGGCSFVKESLVPSLTGEQPNGTSAPQTSPQSSAKPAPAGQSSAAQSAAAKAQPAAAPGQPTGTPVGQKAEEIRQAVAKLEGSVGEHSNQLDALRTETAANVERYQSMVAGINAKLEVGTTAGNPVLLDQWKEAQSTLDKINGNVTAMSSLSSVVASDTTAASTLLDQIHAAYELAGAVDEDHHRLALLEEDVGKTRVTIDRLNGELAAQTKRQSYYLPRERNNLAMLAAAIKSGDLSGAPSTAAAFAPAGTAAIANRKPLVVIRFARPDVKYEQALYQAVNAAIERKPDVDFDLVAVAPAAGDAAQEARRARESKQHADAVMRALAKMGLPANRVTLSAVTSGAAEASEVRLYVR